MGMSRASLEKPKSRSVPPVVPIDGYSVLDLLKARMYGSPDDAAYKYFEIYYKYVYKSTKNDKVKTPEMDEESLKELEDHAAELIEEAEPVEPIVTGEPDDNVPSP